MSSSETSTAQNSSTDKEEKLKKLSSKSTSSSTSDPSTVSQSTSDSPSEPSTESAESTESTTQPETNTTESASRSSNDGESTEQPHSDHPLSTTEQESTVEATSKVESNTETTVACSTFESFTQYAKTFNDEVQIDIDDTGFKTYSPDPANAALVNTHLHRSGFKTLTSDERSIGIDIERLSSSVSLFDSTTTIKLSQRHQGTTQHISDGTLSFNFSHIALEHLPEKNEIPEFDYPVEVVIDCSKFEQTINAVSMVGETVRMQTNPPESELTVYCNGDTDSTSQTFTINGGNSYINKSVETLFSLDYLRDILQAIDSQVEEITVKLGEKKPLKVCVEQEDITTEFLLAPKIEDN